MCPKGVETATFQSYNAQRHHLDNLLAHIAEFRPRMLFLFSLLIRIDDRIRNEDLNTKGANSFGAACRPRPMEERQIFPPRPGE